MASSAQIVLSTDDLVHHGQSWPGVPLILFDGLLEPVPSEWILDMRVRGCADNTLISYAKTFAIWLDALKANKMHWKTVKASAAERFMAMLVREGSATGTVRLRMIHVQSFYAWAKDKGYMASVPFQIKSADSRRAAKKPLAVAPEIKLPASVNRQVRAQTQQSFDKVLANTPRKGSAVVLRDELIAEAARYMGLRRSEIANLRAEQFLALDLEEDVLVIKVKTAKSRRDREDSVLVPRLYAKKMKDYIQIQRAAMVAKFKKSDPEYADPGILFLNERGKHRGEGVSPNYIGDSWRRSANIAGVDYRFHDNRSSFGTNAAKAARAHGAQAKLIVKELLRHSREETSEIYVKYDEIQADRLLRAKLVNDAYFEGTKGAADGTP